MHLAHHGIKGQKWGVRRFQNEDGSWTEEGNRRRKLGRNVSRNIKYTSDVNDIVRSMSSRDKKLLGASESEDWIQSEFEYETLSNKANTFVKSVENVPVSFLEIWTNESRTGQIAIGTRSGDQYRGKGYASSLVKEAIEWTDRYGSKSIDELEWWARADNADSNKLAVNNGFVKDEKSGSYNGKDWNHYIRKTKI